MKTADIDVSVVIAVKDGARTLQRCLDSVFAQRGSTLETLVIDGGSRDGTAAILQANRANLAFTCSEPDSGIYAAWNKALPRVGGEWVCFLGCDDALHDPSAICDLLQAAARFTPRPSIVYGKLNLVTPRGLVAETVGRPWSEAREDFLAGFMLPTPAMLHHRLLFERHGLFDESYRIAGDYEFALRELKDGNAVFVNRVVADMQIGGLSGAPQSIYLALQEVRRAREAHGLQGAPLRARLALVASRVGARLHRLLGAKAFALFADAYRLVRGKPRIWTV
jgi:GT2 family glycosyltransferase